MATVEQKVKELAEKLNVISIHLFEEAAKEVPEGDTVYSLAISARAEAKSFIKWYVGE